MHRHFVRAALVVAVVLGPVRAVRASEADTPEAPKVAPAPSGKYSLPWMLRPAVPATVARLDTVGAWFNGGSTVVTGLIGSYRVTRSFAPVVRMALVSHQPDAGGGRLALTNPVLGATYAIEPAPEWRIAAFLGATVPVGSGGGNTPSPEVAAAVRAGIPARSAMDNAMFAVNDFTVLPGVDVAWVKGRFTAQGEATVLFLSRVRGERVQADARRINLTAGLHLGYFVLDALSVGAELRMQHWLSTPVAVSANPKARDTRTAALGLRYHQKVGPVLLRPGVSYTRPLDAPLSAQGYQMFQLDLPFVF